jgi:hypothetical protein
MKRKYLRKHVKYDEVCVDWKDITRNFIKLSLMLGQSKQQSYK